MRLPAFQIQVGDFLDLEGDKYADPTHDNPSLACLLAEVISVEDEDKCIAISFEGFDIVGFPRHHLLNVCKSGT